jgi:hypothetical protein
MNEKIIRIQFYQAVYVGATIITNLTTAQPPTQLKEATLEFMPNNGVLITNGTHRTLVPLNNVAFMQFAPAEVKLAKAAK